MDCYCKAGKTSFHRPNMIAGFVELVFIIFRKIHVQSLFRKADEKDRESISASRQKRRISEAYGSR